MDKLPIFSLIVLICQMFVFQVARHRAVERGINKAPERCKARSAKMNDISRVFFVLAIGKAYDLPFVFSNLQLCFKHIFHTSPPPPLCLTTELCKTIWVIRGLGNTPLIAPSQCHAKRSVQIAYLLAVIYSFVFTPKLIHNLSLSRFIMTSLFYSRKLNPEFKVRLTLLLVSFGTTLTMTSRTKLAKIIKLSTCNTTPFL